MEIETPRTILRKFKPEDSASFFELNRDPEVLRFTFDKPFDDENEARSFIQKYDHYDKHGFGRWAVVLKETNEFIGFCGLKNVAERNEINLGFRFYTRCWNKGYATETGVASIKHGFENFGLKTIVARAMKENFASIRVMEKCGMSYWKECDFEGSPGIYYQIENVEMGFPA